MRRRMHRRSERGFALLLVFAMAAAAVVMLYLEAPRLAVEALRNKEQTLIDRGEQYKRAIQVFVRANKTYPKSLEELEKFQDKRFLRHRYKDPFTGEDEWRLIHYENGMFPDSKVYGPKKKDGEKEPRQTFVAELPTVGNPGAQDPNDPNAQNPALQKRASDRPAIASGQGGDTQTADPNAPPGDPNQMQGQPGQGQGPALMPPGGFAGVPPAPGQPGAAPVIPNAPGIPGMPSFRPANPLQNMGPGQPGQGAQGGSLSGAGGFIGGSIPAPGGVSNSQAGGFIGATMGGSNSPAAGAGQAGRPPMPGTTGMGGGGIPGMPGQGFGGAPGPVPTAAADLIRQILTTPRAGGMPGAQGLGQGGLGAGIAGVASKKEATGIKIYNERTRYDEWEFLYDPSKDVPKGMQQAGGAQGTNQPGGPLQGGQSGSGTMGGGMGGSMGGRMGTQSGSSFSTGGGSSTSSGSGGGFIGGAIPQPKQK